MHPADLQVTLTLLGHCFLFSLICLCAASYLNIEQLDALVDLVVHFLLANLHILLPIFLQIVKRADLLTSDILYAVLLDILGEVLVTLH